MWSLDNCSSCQDGCDYSLYCSGSCLYQAACRLFRCDFIATGAEVICGLLGALLILLFLLYITKSVTTSFHRMR